MINLDKTLFLIMARGGSKGLPNKNIKLLNQKPLILYSIEHARIFSNDSNICVSTDSQVIKEIVESVGLKIPFLRPEKLATDTADTYDVIMHALEYYKDKGISYETIFILQPTSPLRKKEHMEKAMDMYDDKLDMVVSVKIPEANPYYNLFEENENGFLLKCKPHSYTRRQDCPLVYQFNGSIYIMNVNSLSKSRVTNFKKIRKVVMEEIYSIDIDNEFDFKMAEIVINDLIEKR